MHPISRYLAGMRRKLSRAHPTTATRGRPCIPGRYEWLDVLTVGQQQIWPWDEQTETLDAYRLRIASLKRAVNAYKQRTGKKFRWSPWYQVVPLIVDGRQGSQIIGRGTRVTRIL